MLDIKWIRENKVEFVSLLLKRGVVIDVEKIIELDKQKRRLIALVEKLKHTKNKKSKELLELKNNPLEEKFKTLKKDIEHINTKLVDLSKLMSNTNLLRDILDNIPNLPGDGVPSGTHSKMNQFVHDFKEPVEKKWHKEHFELGLKLNMMDFEQTAKFSGSRFVTLKEDLATLERALFNFMLDTHTLDFGFKEISPPALVKPEAMYNTAQLPKLDSESYTTSDKKFRLIPTGEVPLVNMVTGKLLQRDELPLRYVAYTNCYRSEAGSAGKDTKGMIRNHQFGKVELVSITTPEESELEHMYMLSAAEEILKRLDIPYRVMLLCAGDMSFSAKKTFDIEVWLPGQKKYREISSISNCGDFQARRMDARYKEFINEKGNRFVHTLNGSGLAVGRTLVAVLENYQNEDGSITVPKVLISYMKGKSIIS